MEHAALIQLIDRYKADHESVYNTWFVSSAERMKAFDGFIVDEAKMARAASDALFMHCLPAHRGEEVAAEVIDGPQSVVWDEAENRLHVQKALIEYLLLGRIED